MWLRLWPWSKCETTCGRECSWYALPIPGKVPDVQAEQQSDPPSCRAAGFDRYLPHPLGVAGLVARLAKLQNGLTERFDGGVSEVLEAVFRLWLANPVADGSGSVDFRVVWDGTGDGHGFFPCRPRCALPFVGGL